MACAVISVTLPIDTPVVNIALEPYIRVKRPDNSPATIDDIPSEGLFDGRYQLRARWYRSKFATGGFCVYHSDKEATLQCAICAKRRIAPLQHSYFCSAACLKANWHKHREAHERHSSLEHNGGAPNGANHNFQRSTTIGLWFEVAHTKSYTPTSDDVGHILRFECELVDKQTSGTEGGSVHSVQTERVRPEPSPPVRHMVPLPPGATMQNRGNFTLLTYNVLAELYTYNSSATYSHCPNWAVSWTYRRHNLIKELMQYSPDIICLQEVQAVQFSNFLQAKLSHLGYEGIYISKTGEMFTGSEYDIDGCATFFKRERFIQVKKYEVEFNKAAQSMTEKLPAAKKKSVLNRLMKDNVALIVVLESKDHINPATAARGRRSMICVANTHIHANPEMSDVKLWQVHTLLKGLEKIAASADIPILVAGDFNSTPGSPPHELLVTGSIRPDHPGLAVDPLQIIDLKTMKHSLKLASSYSAARRATNTTDQRLSDLISKIDSTYGEPLCTNITGDFQGTLDYLLFTCSSLVPTALLELPPSADVRAGLPSIAYPSDHIALMAEFAFV